MTYDKKRAIHPLAATANEQAVIAPPEPEFMSNRNIRAQGLFNIRSLRLAAILLAFVLFVGAFFYRDDLFQYYLDPGQPFQTYTPPPALDYGEKQAWLARPDLTQDASLTPGNGDIFVVTPTLYLGGRDWVAPVQNEDLSQKTLRIAVPNYVQPYALAGRLFAPTYRHASLYSFLTNRDDARMAQNFAYADVARAFEVFLAEHQPERPIVLIGHGQGALHVQRLLAQYFNGPGTDARRQALAAAYIIDHPTPKDLFSGALSQTPPCAAKDDTACIVAFGAFMPKDGVAARQFVSNTLIFDGPRLTSTEGRPLSCMNPLLWTLSADYAPARLHKGGVAAEGLTPGDLAAPMPRQTGAQCQDGLLLVDKPKQKSLRRPVRFGGRYRTLPSNLFYEDLRSNVVTRIEAVIAKNILPRRAPLLDGLEEIEIIDSPVTLPDEN